MIPTATMMKEDPFGIEAGPGNFAPLTRNIGDEMIVSFLMKIKDFLKLIKNLVLKSEG